MSSSSNKEGSEQENVPENENPVVTKLRTVFKEKGIDRATFLVAKEEWRKRALGEDYDKVRSNAQWVYDQPISATKVETEEGKTSASSTSAGGGGEYTSTTTGTKRSTR